MQIFGLDRIKDGGTAEATRLEHHVLSCTAVGEWYCETTAAWEYLIDISTQGIVRDPESSLLSEKVDLPRSCCLRASLDEKVVILPRVMNKQLHDARNMCVTGWRMCSAHLSTDIAYKGVRFNTKIFQSHEENSATRPIVTMPRLIRRRRPLLGRERQHSDNWQAYTGRGPRQRTLPSTKAVSRKINKANVSSLSGTFKVVSVLYILVRWTVLLGVGRQSPHMRLQMRCIKLTISLQQRIFCAVTARRSFAPA